MTSKLPVFLPDWDITLKVSIVHLSLKKILDNFQYFEGDFYLIQHWGDECSFLNNITKNARSPVTYKLSMDRCDDCQLI